MRWIIVAAVLVVLTLAAVFELGFDQILKLK